MIFEKIHTVPTSDELIDKAFRRATRAKAGKNSSKRRTIAEAQESMIITAGNILSDNLSNIVRRFPSFDSLPDFYYELVDIVVGVDELRAALGSADWAASKTHEISREYVGRIRDGGDPITIRKEAFGRLASVMASVSKKLIYLNSARNILRKLPDIRVEPTLVVAGYPNVGKSSFVSIVTGARPEVASYPFTTKGVLIGHFQRDGIRYQVIDTPGLLDRPMAERNDVEMQAITAIKYLNCVLLFIVDPTESCGFEVKDQLNLLSEVKENFPMPVLVVANKSDLAHSDIPMDMSMSTLTGEGVEEVADRLVGMVEVKEESMEDHMEGMSNHMENMGGPM